MDATFAAPIYEPAPYMFSGRTLQELPLLARYYLADVAQILPPVAYQPGRIEEKRTELALALFRSLQGTDIAMVEHRQAARMASRWPTETVQEWHQRITNLDMERLVEVVGVLLPERQMLLDEFMIKFDALVWLELEGQGWSVQEQQGHRERLCMPLLDYTNQALLALDEAVMRRMPEGKRTCLSEDGPETSLTMEWSEEASPIRTPRVLLPRRSMPPIPDLEETMPTILEKLEETMPPIPEELKVDMPPIPEELEERIHTASSPSIESVQRRLRFIREVHGKFSQRVASEQ